MTKKEKLFRNKIFNNYYYATKRLYERVAQTEPKLKSISFTVKRENENSGQYGFYLTESNIIIELVDILNTLKINSLIDLGCGTGNVLTSLTDFFEIYKVKGFEIEQDLIDVGRKYFRQNNIEKKDILKLTKKDIQGFQALYFWEPLYDNELAKKFVKNLEKILSSDQVIIYQCSGRIKDHLDDSKIIEKTLNTSHLHIYRKTN